MEYDRIGKIGYNSKKEINKVDALYEKEIRKNGCAECKVYFEMKGRPLQDHFLICGDCPKKKRMQIVNEKFINASKEMDRLILEVFPRIVFEELIKEDPLIYSRRTKKHDSFSVIFGTSFSKVPKEMYPNLTGLITEDCGLYRLYKGEIK